MLFHHTVLSVYSFGPQGLPQLHAKLKLRKLCAQYQPVKGSGYLSIEKIEEGYDTNDDFKNKLQETGIEREHLRTVFTILEPCSGKVAYEDFCDGLHAKAEEACLLAVRCRSCTKQSRAHAHARNLLESWLAPLSWRCAASSSGFLKYAQALARLMAWSVG